MKKRKKVLTMSLALLITCSELGSVHKVSAATDSNYIGSKAATYAGNWYNGYNTTEYYKADLDCTNFVSQCLEKGGKKRSTKLPSYTDINYWRPHSATWESANYFKKYWVTQVKSAGKSISGMTKSEKSQYALDVISKITVGDVVQYGVGSDAMRHSQIVYKSRTISYGGKVWDMAQHTSPSKTINLHDYIRDTGYTYVRYYDMDQLK